MGIGREVTGALFEAIGTKAAKHLRGYIGNTVPKADIPVLVRLGKENTPELKKWVQHSTDYVNGQPAGGLQATTIVDTAKANFDELDLKNNLINQKHLDPLQPENITTGISAADKQVADELAGSPEGIKWFEERLVRKKELEDRILSHKERGKKGYSRTDPELFAHKGREDKAIATDVRTGSDNLSTARPQWISEYISDPVRAEPGYGKAAGVKNPQRDPKLGFKPSNKDLETGISYKEYLEQHHLLFNREGSALFQQQLFKDDPGFVVAMQRYIAKKYDAAFGEAAQNMANLPADQVHAPYHRWLRELQLDGVSGKNYEQFWKQKYLENPNMTAQQLQDAVDEWFEEIIFPSIIVLDDLMSKADLSKVNAKDIAFPKSLLKQARASIQNELKPIKPRAKKGSTAADIQIDDLQARAEAGEFGQGRRSWFKDSKARNRAKEIVQQ